MTTSSLQRMLGGKTDFRAGRRLDKKAAAWLLGEKTSHKNGLKRMERGRKWAARRRKGTGMHHRRAGM